MPGPRGRYEFKWQKSGAFVGSGRAVAEQGLPDEIQMDNGPEFRSKALDLWAYENKVKLVFIEPGKPVQNAHIESFNGKLRNECLDL